MTQFDAFLSHNSADKEIVRTLAEKLRADGLGVWFDEWELRPGATWQSGIEQGLKQSRATAVFIGPHDLGKWETPEMQVALDLQAKRSYPVIPVLLPGITDEIKAGIPLLLQRFTWVDFTRGADDAKALDQLIWAITGKKPERQQPEPAAPALPASAMNQGTQLEEAVANLVQRLRKGNATFFLGWGVEAAGPARTHEIARALLLELQLIGREDTPLLPLDLAGLYYAIGKNDDSFLEDKVTELLLARTEATTSTHENLVKLLQLLQQRGTRRVRRHVPQLIVTTSPDVLMERALLRAGMPFARLVQHRSAQQITINHYRQVELQGDLILVQDEAESRKPYQARRDNLQELDDIIAQAGEQVIRYKPASGRENQLNELSLETLTEPILYKFLGSQDVTNSCVLSTSQYFEFAQHALQRRCIPEQLSDIIANHPAVLLGCGYLDPDFRLLCQLLLRKQLEVETNGALRYALQLPPGAALPSRRVEDRLWGKLKETVLKEIGLTTLEGRADAFLQMLIEAWQA